MTERRKLLLVEDDAELAAMIVSFLSDEGFVVDHVDNGLEVQPRVLRDPPDLLILDIMLPGMDGLEVCRQIGANFDHPILMLTAKDDDLAEITSLNRGADGFLTKPVRAHVLLAHINALLRRVTTGASEPKDDNTVQVQDLVIEKNAFTASLGGEVVDLTTAEFELLLYLAENHGRVISRDQLYRAIRGIEYDGMDRSIDMRISSLREKLHDEHPPYKYIKTIRGKGYLFAA